MGVLCDTNILIDLHGRAQEWRDWSRTVVAELRRETILIINPIIYAEFSIGYRTVSEVDEVLDARLYERQPLPWEAGFHAGVAFLSYRRQGGKKRSPLPDFYIGAHAFVAGHRLLTRDPSRYRTHFPGLDIVSPETRP